MKNSIIVQFIVASVLIIALHTVLFLTNALHGPLKIALVLDGAMLIIFASSLLVMVPGIKNAKDTFALRFLGLTTIQMLTVMTLMVVLVVKKMPDAKFWLLNTVTIFMCMLCVQSVLLIRSLNAK